MDQREGEGRATGKALALNTTLMALKLEANMLGEEGGRAIGQTLQGADES